MIILRYEGTNKVEPRFSEPPYNEVLGITNVLFSLAKVTLKWMGQNHDITKTFQKLKRIIYLDITKKCHHVTIKIVKKLNW